MSQCAGLPADGPPCYNGPTHADVAQLVEHDLAKKKGTDSTRCPISDNRSTMRRFA